MAAASETCKIEALFTSNLNGKRSVIAISTRKIHGGDTATFPIKLSKKLFAALKRRQIRGLNIRVRLTFTENNGEQRIESTKIKLKYGKSTAVTRITSA